jgi:putative toxin-antitoxin system antitoxin component (TIGR02293 family)
MSTLAAEAFHVLSPDRAAPSGSLEVALELSIGVPAAGIDHVRRYTGLSLSELLMVVPSSTSTLKRRRSTDALLPASVADALFRLVQVFRQAEQVLGSRDKARNWLLTPSRALNHHAPLALLASTPGTRIVEAELAAIDHGFGA